MYDFQISCYRFTSISFVNYIIIGTVGQVLSHQADTFVGGAIKEPGGIVITFHLINKRSCPIKYFHGILRVIRDTSDPEEIILVVTITRYPIECFNIRDQFDRLRDTTSQQGSNRYFINT